MTLATLTAAGWLLLYPVPGYRWVPQVQQGLSRSVIDACSTNLGAVHDENGVVVKMYVGTGYQVGAIVTPVHGAVIVHEIGLTWTTSQLDFDADGELSGTDAALWLAFYDQQSPLCDFSADGQTNADDFTLWRLAVEAARPGYVVACDVDRSGWVDAMDFDLYVDWFIAGDARADFIPDGWVTGDDYDGFTQAFEQGR